MERKTAIKARRQRTKDATERLNAFNGQQKDWYAACRWCGTSLEGSIAELKAHRCKRGV